MEDFSFKYVPEAELSKIVKQVQRDRRKKNEEKEWEEYLEMQKLKLQNRNIKEKGIFTGITYTSGFKDDLDQPHECIQSTITSNDHYSTDKQDCNIEETLSINLEKVNKLDKLRIFDSPDFNGIGSTLPSESDQHCHPQNIGESCHWYNHEKQPCRKVSSELSMSQVNKNYHRNYGDGACVHNQSKGHQFSNCNRVKVNESVDKCRNSASTNAAADKRNKSKVSFNEDSLKVNSTDCTEPVNELIEDIPYSSLIDPSSLDSNVIEDFNRIMSFCKNTRLPRNNCLTIASNQNTIPCQDNDISSSLSTNDIQTSDCVIKKNFSLSHKTLQKLSTIHEENSSFPTDEIVESNYFNPVDIQISEIPSALIISNDCENSDASHIVSVTDNELNKDQATILNGEIKVRIDNLKMKLTAALNKLLDLSSKSYDVDDDIDIERKVKKTKEFVSRFSRNYLYQLRRQVETIKKLNVNLSSPQIFYHKLFLSYQISLQALQAFQNILPDKSKLSYDKIVEFLQLFLSALDYFEQQFDDTSNNHEIRTLCNTLIAAFKNNNQSQIKDENLSSNCKSDYESNTNNNPIKYTKKKGLKKQKLSKKLSMYCTSDSNGLPVNWKVTSAGLARKKFGSPNKKIPSNLNSKSGITSKKDGDSAVGNSARSKELSVTSPKCDNSCNNDANNNSINNKNDVCGSNTLNYKLESSLLLEPPIEVSTVIENCLIDDTDGKDDLEFKSHDERTKIFLLFDRLSEMLSQNEAEKENLKLKNNEDVEEQNNKTKMTKEEMKNVLQQINELYLHSDSLGLTASSLDSKCAVSVSNSSGNIKSLSNSNVKQSKSDVKNVGYKDILFDEEEHKKKCQKDVTKGEGRIPCVPLEISDEQLQSILKYRNDFMNYTNSSPFYEQFNERWNIVKRIGDNLLPKLLSDVSQELEINLLVQKMYDLEFTQQT